MTYSPQIIPCATEADWHRERSNLLGASEIPALFGLSPFETPRQLWLRKCGQGSLPKDETEAMTAGKFLEDGNARWYAHASGRPVVTPQEFYGHIEGCRTAFQIIVRHPTLPLQCTPDRFTSRHIEAGVLQLKNTSGFVDEWDEQAPLHVQIQVQAELLCTGLSWGVAAAVIGGNKRRDFDIERHEGFLATLAEKAERFFKEPAPEPSAGDLDYIKATFPTSTPGSVLEYPRPEELMELATLKAQRSALEERCDALQAKVLETIGNAETILVSGVKVGTYKSTVRHDPPREAREYSIRTLRIDKLLKQAKATSNVIA